MDYLYLHNIVSFVWYFNAYNYLINNQLNGDEYTFSRWLMGIAQSPLVAFFMIASSKLYNKFQTEQ
jgi:hypothetical protein